MRAAAPIAPAAASAASPARAHAPASPSTVRRPRRTGRRSGRSRSAVAYSLPSACDLLGGLSQGHAVVDLLGDALLRDLAAELPGHPSASDHDHAIADRGELLVVRARAEHAGTRFRGLAEYREDLSSRS